MRVADLLNAKGSDVVTIAPDATLGDAVHMLQEHRIGALVACDERRSVVGILSERDVVRTLANTGAEALDEPVSGVMTQLVSTCGMDDGLADLARRMTEGRFRHLPVVEGGELLGIISIGDVVKRRLDMLETEQEQLTTYIQTGR